MDLPVFEQLQFCSGEELGSLQGLLTNANAKRLLSPLLD
jgi:hypothetical protein